jgi:membrane protein
MFRRHGISASGPHRPLRTALRLAPLVALGAAALWPRRGRGGLAEKALNTLQPGRGRLARSPQEIPLRGWRDILWRTWREFNKDQITTVAGGVTFFGLLAFFPGIAAFVSLYGLFADFHDAVKHVEIMALLAPRDAVVFIGAQMIRIADGQPSSLSLTFVVTLLLSLWSANSGIKSLFNGLNVAYGEREKRSYLKRTLFGLLFTVAALAFLLVCMGVLVAVPLLLPIVQRAAPWLALLRWPLLLVMAMGALSVVYRYGPSRERARWQWITWGSAAATVLWLIASLAFSWYLSNLANYDKTYGSFGAAAGAMTWLWITNVIILAGAELNAEIEHQTAVDSTTGPPMPMGVRGAVMADTVGRARKS